MRRPYVALTQCQRNHFNVCYLLKQYVYAKMCYLRFSFLEDVEIIMFCVRYIKKQRPYNFLSRCELLSIEHCYLKLND